MQKKLLVAAVAGALAVPAVANAQTSVQIYGAFDMSLHQYRVGAGTAAGSTSISKWDVYNQSSRLGFKGTEDMGGGMKAWFQLESNVAADGRHNAPGAVNLASRNTGVGLTGGWGSVLLGFWDSPYKALGSFDNASVGGLPGHRGVLVQNGDTSGSNPNMNCGNLGGAMAAGATVFCGQVESGAASFHRRLSNTVQYWSPVFAGGFDVKFAFTANEEKSTAGAVGNNNPHMWAITGAYNSKVWRAFLGYERHQGYRDAAGAGLAGSVLPQNVKDSGWLIGGGYNFGVVDLSVAYEQLKFADTTGVAATANDFKRNNWFVGIAVPIGSAGSAIRAGYSKTPGNKSCGAGTVCADTGARVLTLGYDHALSKRTSVYVAYGSLNNDAAAGFVFNSSPTGTSGVGAGNGAGADQSSIGIGVKHSF